MFSLCAPALIYVAFSLTQIVIDTFKGLYNTAFFKVIVMVIITILLNSLCQAGMGIISWIIVFIPFIFMSVIVAILLYVFGLDPATGNLDIKCDETKNNTIIKTQNNTIKHIDVTYADTPLDSIDNNEVAPYWSSDPQYE